MSTTREGATFPDLGRAHSIALTTFRKSGQAVTTPVWFAQRPGMIYVETGADTGKLKRLRHTARVTLAPCTYSGKVTGAEIAGTARILTEPGECTSAATALARKYRVMIPLMRTVWHLLRRKAEAEEVYLAIEPLEEK